MDQLEQWSTQLPPNSHLIFEYTATYSARLGWVLALHNRPFSILTPNHSKGFATTCLLVRQQGYLTQIALFEDELDQMSQQELPTISERMQRVKGIGPAWAQALCTATTGLAGFESAKAVAKLVGIAPTQTQSGSWVRRRGRMARTGLGYVRGLLYMAARSARTYNLGCKALYERLRAKGRCHKVAMVAVMNKLIHQIFAVVKQDVEFVNGFGLPKQNLA